MEFLEGKTLKQRIEGKPLNTEEILEELKELGRKQYVPASWFAWIYTALGEIGQALEWLEEAVEERDGFIIHLHLDPCWDALRPHPGYHALLRRMNLEP
jgi:hypothetical protein